MKNSFRLTEWLKLTPLKGPGNGNSAEQPASEQNLCLPKQRSEGRTSLNTNPAETVDDSKRSEIHAIQSSTQDESIPAASSSEDDEPSLIILKGGPATLDECDAVSMHDPSLNATQSGRRKRRRMSESHVTAEDRTSHAHPSTVTLRNHSKETPTLHSLWGIRQYSDQHSQSNEPDSNDRTSPDPNPKRKSRKRKRKALESTEHVRNDPHSGDRDRVVQAGNASHSPDLEVMGVESASVSDPSAMSTSSNDQSSKEYSVSRYGRRRNKVDYSFTALLNRGASSQSRDGIAEKKPLRVVTDVLGKQGRKLRNSRIKVVSKEHSDHESENRERSIILESDSDEIREQKSPSVAPFSSDSDSVFEINEEAKDSQSDETTDVDCDSDDLYEPKKKKSKRRSQSCKSSAKKTSRKGGKRQKTPEEARATFFMSASEKNAWRIGQRRLQFQREIEQSRNDTRKLLGVTKSQPMQSEDLKMDDNGNTVASSEGSLSMDAGNPFFTAVSAQLKEAALSRQLSEPSKKRKKKNPWEGRSAPVFPEISHTLPVSDDERDGSVHSRLSPMIDIPHWQDDHTVSHSLELGNEISSAAHRLIEMDDGLFDDEPSDTLEMLEDEELSDEQRMLEVLSDDNITLHRIRAELKFARERQQQFEQYSEVSNESPLIWTDKYEPRKASEILGNESAMLEIKDWMEAWTTAEAKDEYLGLSALANWMGNDDVYLPSDDDEFVLTKSLVLSGPHGCGKTASIYACAGELKLQVMEVNCAGISSGKDLLIAIGEATQCHSVGNDLAASNATLSQCKKKKKRPRKQRLKKESDEESKGQSKRSLIMLDEVDNLINEVPGFLRNVTKALRMAKRPIVLTCEECCPKSISAVINTLAEHPLNQVPTHLAVCRLACILTAECHPNEMVLPKELGRCLSHFYREVCQMDFRKSLLELQSVVCGVPSDWELSRRMSEITRLLVSEHRSGHPPCDSSFHHRSETATRMQSSNDCSFQMNSSMQGSKKETPLWLSEGAILAVWQSDDWAGRLLRTSDASCCSDLLDTLHSSQMVSGNPRSHWTANNIPDFWSDCLNCKSESVRDAMSDGIHIFDRYSRELNGLDTSFVLEETPPPLSESCSSSLRSTHTRPKKTPSVKMKSPFHFLSASSKSKKSNQGSANENAAHQSESSTNSTLLLKEGSHSQYHPLFEFHIGSDLLCLSLRNELDRLSLALLNSSVQSFRENDDRRRSVVLRPCLKTRSRLFGSDDLASVVHAYMNYCFDRRLHFNLANSQAMFEVGQSYLCVLSAMEIKREESGSVANKHNGRPLRRSRRIRGFKHYLSDLECSEDCRRLGKCWINLFRNQDGSPQLFRPLWPDLFSQQCSQDD